MWLSSDDQDDYYDYGYFDDRSVESLYADDIYAYWYDDLSH